MKNIIKGAVTTLVALVIFLIVSYNIFLGKIAFMWEGILGYIAGVVLLFSSDRIIQDIKEVIIAIFKKEKTSE